MTPSTRSRTRGVCAVIALLVALPALAAPLPTFHYPFEGDLADAAGGADGLARNFGADPYVTGTVGARALSFDGVDDYVSLPVSYSSTNYQAVSVSAWVRTTSGANQILLSSDRSEYWRLEINGSGGGTGQVGWDVRTNVGIVDFGSVARVDDGQWHHVVATFDGSSGAMRIYLDGYLDAESVDPARTSYGSGAPRFTFIGRGSEADSFDGATGPNDHIDGDLDELMIFNNVALTPQEVQDLCLVGRGQLNLLDLPLTPYSNLPDTGTAILTPNGSGVGDGRGITLTGPVSRKVPLAYTVTPNTILEFEVEHADGGIVAIGLDEDDDHTRRVADGETPSPRLVSLSGLNAPSADLLVAPHQYVGPGFERMQVCLGRFYQGEMAHLCFHTTGASGTATIRSIRLFEADSYQAWALELPVDQRGPNDDADADGEENLLEYSLGAPPIEASTAKCSTATVESSEVNGMLELRLPHTQKPDVVYVVEVSPDLVTWIPTGLRFKEVPWEELPGAVDQALGEYQLGAKVNLAVAAPTHRFVRVGTILYGGETDLDADQIDDYWEYHHSLDPSNAADAGLDPDGDDLTHLQEFQNGGDPFVNDPAVVSLEVIAGDAYEKEGSPARLRIRRAGSDRDATVFYTIAAGAIPNYGTPQDPDDYRATIDGAVASGFVFMGDGDFEKVIEFEPVADGQPEYPEGIRVTLDVPPVGEPYSLGGATGQDVFICDASNDPANTTLFLGFYRPELNADTTADGIATVKLSGRRDAAEVTSSFGVMQTGQVASHIHSADPFQPDQVRGPILESLPLGQIATTPYAWSIVPVQGWTGQDLVNALFESPAGPGKPPHLYINVHSGQYSGGEIWARLRKVAGASTLPQDKIDQYLNPQGLDLVDNTTGFPPADGLDDFTGDPVRIDRFGNAGFDDLATVTTPASSDDEFAAADDELKREVVRFLQQATMGPRPKEVNALYKEIVVNHGGDRVAGFNAWIDAQLALDQTLLRELAWYFDEQEFIHRAEVDPDADGVITERLFPDAGDQPFGGNFRRAWWTQTMQCHDQLLQRYILALSEIVVVSTNDAVLGARSVAVANYWDMLGRAIQGEIDTIDPSSGAMQTKAVPGTYRDVLEAVSKSPVMGIYLSHLKNEKAQDLNGDGVTDLFPDENYAREIMQLFSFGLVQLLADGTIQLDQNGSPIATYTNDDIKELARVFTGWSFSHYHLGTGATNPREIVTNDNFLRGNGSQYFTATYEFPMKNFPAYHDTDEKVFLGGTVPAGLDGEGDLQGALDLIAGHPTVPPFMAVRLIKRLTSANPSSGYVYRVARAYESGTAHGSGSGQRGDLQAVLKAILLDPEARDLARADQSIGAGKLKEPLLSFGQILRGLQGRSRIPLHADFVFDGATGAGVPTTFTLPSIGSINGSPFSSTPNAGYPASQLDNFDADATLLRFFDMTDDLGQDPMRSPTVFNWFLPDYSPGGTLAAAGLTSPELQIATETSVVELINEIHGLTRGTNGLGAARLAGDRAPALSSSADRYDSVRIDDDHENMIDGNAMDRDLLEVLWNDVYGSTPGTIQQKRTAAATALVDWLDLYFCAGRLKAQYASAPLPNPRSEIIDAVDSQSGYDTTTQTGREMIRSALYLVLTSPDFLTQN